MFLENSLFGYNFTFAIQLMDSVKADVTAKGRTKEGAFCFLFRYRDIC